MKIIQGSTYYIGADLTDMNDNLLDINEIELVEFYFDKDIRKIYPSDDVQYLNNKFIIYLSQEDTFAMKENLSYQVRVKYKNGQVKGSVLYNTNTKRTLSKEVL